MSADVEKIMGKIIGNGYTFKVNNSEVSIYLPSNGTLIFHNSSTWLKFQIHCSDLLKLFDIIFQGFAA